MTKQDAMTFAEYRAIITRRFVELGRLGANADVNHPGRKQWERLRREIEQWGVNQKQGT